jgi:hypothetical protein
MRVVFDLVFAGSSIRPSTRGFLPFRCFFFALASTWVGRQVVADDPALAAAEMHMPLIQGQHYLYLVRQFDRIRDGKRRNADPEMVEQIQSFTPRDVAAIMDYTSRLRPPPKRVGAPDYRNPDFANFRRRRLQRPNRAAGKTEDAEWVCAPARHS